MQNSNNEKIDAKLQMGFPKCNEDHRLQLVEINGSMFAILHALLESEGPIALHCEEWSLILLAPIKSKSNILISAINVICLSEIESKEGVINLHASNRLVKFAQLIKSDKVSEMGECGEFEFDDDPGAFLNYFRLFESVLRGIHTNTSESTAEAQQKFIGSLCSLAEKIEDSKDPLTLGKVLSCWNIPYLKS